MNVLVEIKNDVIIPRCNNAKNFAKLIGKENLGLDEGSWGNKNLQLIQELGFTIHFVETIK
tara:strand:- start:4169 stop:4351 length:183 start_codon:yes stop_codon:yes gene_type:complete